MSQQPPISIIFLTNVVDIQLGKHKVETIKNSFPPTPASYKPYHSAAVAIAAEMIIIPLTSLPLLLPCKTALPDSSDTEMIKEVPMLDNEAVFYVEEAPNAQPL